MYKIKVQSTLISNNMVVTCNAFMIILVSVEGATLMNEHMTLYIMFVIPSEVCCCSSELF